MAFDNFKNNQDIGLVSTVGGVVNAVGVTLGADFIFPSGAITHAHIGSGGDIYFIMDEKGTLDPYLNVLDGTFIITKAIGIRATGTTCTGITWHIGG